MVSRNISYGSQPLGSQTSQKLDQYLADGYSSGTHPLFVFFHGGGLEAGDKGDGLNPAFLELACAGISVASADYRMYPEARFPNFIEDAAECVAWCAKHIPHSGIYIGGSSAGAYLAMMLAFDPKYLGAYGIDCADKFQISGYIFDAGQPTVHFNVLRERGLDTRLIRVDEAAPLYFISQPENPEKLPSYELIVSDGDMYNRLEQNRLLYRTLLHFGYPEEKVSFRLMEGYSHCGYTDVILDDGSSLYAKLISEFIGK